MWAYLTHQLRGLPPVSGSALGRNQIQLGTLTPRRSARNICGLKIAKLRLSPAPNTYRSLIRGAVYNQINTLINRVGGEGGGIFFALITESLPYQLGEREIV